MFRPVRSHRPLTAAFLGVLTAGALAQPAYAGPAAPEVPGNLVVGDGHKPFLVGHAVGVQSHTCKLGTTGYGWAFDGPTAVLYDDHGKAITTHFSGPTWEAKDGSRAVGKLVDKATVDPTAIPWLLLSATGTAGADGDRLAGTTFIHRIATTGGLAPAAAECTADTAGQTRHVDYTADYVFWKATG